MGLLTRPQLVSWVESLLQPPASLTPEPVWGTIVWEGRAVSPQLWEWTQPRPAVCATRSGGAWAHDQEGQSDFSPGLPLSAAARKEMREEPGVWESVMRR